MTPKPATPELRVALAGNPNSGKTTLFNALTGLRQKVGNYPGVTVERRSGQAVLATGRRLEIVDLPGTYSLGQRAPDEAIAVAMLCGSLPGERSPDVILNIVDASNLGRNLFLSTQLLELGLPVVVALNMMDLARRSGCVPDPRALEAALGVPVVALDDHLRPTLRHLLDRIEEAAAGPAARPVVELDPGLAAAVSKLTELPGEAGRSRASILIELLTPTGDAGGLTGGGPGRSAFYDQARDLLDREHPDWWQVEAKARYVWIDAATPRVTGHCVTANTRAGFSRGLDGLLLHRLFGPLAFLLVMGGIFQGIFTWSATPSEWLEQGMGAAAEAIGRWIGPGMLHDLLVDGVFAGVLNVVIFLPQIIILFLAIGVLEDSGYLARAAFIVDRPMRRLGLHGRSFVPMMSSFACAIPGILGTRTIENPGARLTTILVAPLMSCSARLPVYTLVIAAFFGESRLPGGFSTAGVVLLAMYALGMVAATAMAFLFRRTVIRGEAPTLVMELPPYRLPRPGTVLRNVAERAYSFLSRVWTVILALTVILWFLQNFPSGGAESELRRQEVAALEVQLEGSEGAGLDAASRADLETRRAAILRQDRAEILRKSYAGRLGQTIEPLIRPLGFDWQIGIGLVASFAAREVIVSTLAQIFAVDEDDNRLAVALRTARDPVSGAALYRPLTGLSLMVFFVLACQCMSTIAVVRRETGGWKWPAFMFTYMSLLAWFGSFATFQVGSLLGY